jgi:pimeloyl-ACP methyl ester carboxylesterase
VESWDPTTDTAGMQRYAAHFADSVSHYPILVAKLKDLWLHHPTADKLGPAVLAHVTAPTLVIDGDHESALPEHTISIWRSLPHAELFIVPGISHHSIREHPEWINPIIESFLQKEFPAP